MSKRIPAFLLSLIFLLPLCAHHTPALTLNLGDTNDDGAVNSIDASTVLKYDVGTAELSAMALIVSDVNRDSCVDNLDAAFILKYDAGIISELPAIEIDTEDSSVQESESESAPAEVSEDSEESSSVSQEESAEEPEYSEEEIPELTYEDDALTYFRSSNNPEEYIKMSINGDILTVSGKLDIAGLDAAWIRIFRAEDDALVDGEYLETAPNTSFHTSFDLSESTERRYICVFHHEADEVYSWSYLEKKRYFIGYGENGYYFERPAALEHNKEKLAEHINPENGFYPEIDEQIRDLSDALAGNASGDYEKMYTLFNWVCGNIYYDYDFYTGVTDSTNLSPESVYENRYSVCQGYTNLLCALLQAQGIPCFTTECYAQFPIGASDLENNTVNHVIAEAYLAEEDRWVIMDPTWSSANVYQNGEFRENYNTTAHYFDIRLEELSVCHKILRRLAPWFWYM